MRRICEGHDDHKVTKKWENSFRTWEHLTVSKYSQFFDVLYAYSICPCPHRSAFKHVHLDAREPSLYFVHNKEYNKVRVTKQQVTLHARLDTCTWWHGKEGTNAVWRMTSAFPLSGIRESTLRDSPRRYFSFGSTIRFWRRALVLFAHPRFIHMRSIISSEVFISRTTAFKHIEC